LATLRYLVKGREDTSFYQQIIGFHNNWQPTIHPNNEPKL